MNYRVSLLFVLLSVAPAVGTVQAARVDDDSRVRQVKERLETAKTIVAQTTNDTEKAMWRDRVKLIENELDNVRKIVQLNRQEEDSSFRQRQSPEYALRDAISMVDTDAADSEREARKQRSRTKSLMTERAELEKLNRQIDAKLDAEEGSKQRAQRNAKIQNLDAEIMVAVYQCEAADLHTRVAREAERIEASSFTNILIPKATVHLIMLKRQAVANSRKASSDYARLADNLKKRRAQTVEVLNFSDQKFKHLDQDIASLRDAYRDARKAKVGADNREANQNYQLNLRTAIDVAESEKDQMEVRLASLQNQVAQLDRSIGLTEHGTALLDAETDFLAYEMSALKWRYGGQIVVPTVFICILCVLYYLVSRHVFPRFYQKDALFLARRMGRYVLIMLIIVALVTFFFDDLRAIATVLGIVGAAIVIALQDLCSSVAGWFVIVASGKIKVGDRVEIDGHKGDIIDLQLLRITLVEINNWLGEDEPTGRVILIPNSFIFKSSVFNYSHVHPFIWDKADITVTYETPIKAAYDLLLRVLTEETRAEFEESARGEDNMEKLYGLKHAISGPRVDTIIADSGVCFRLLYASHFKRVGETRNKLMTRILAEFEKDPDMQFAYPTRRQIQSVVPMPAPVVR